MNKEFIKKMIKAEMLKYEAIKEVLPENTKKHISTLEREAVDFLKDIAMEMIKDDKECGENETKKETKKVKVDFS